MKNKKIFVVALALLGWIVLLYRFYYGLGRTTNLSDTYPWGLWIGFDVISGVALAAGGFTIAATVYIFKLKKYQPLARPAILTGFLGYLLAILGVAADLAKPQNIWHMIPYRNVHSVMLEVGWCVMLYTTVIGLEFSPAVFERFGWKVPLNIIRAIQIPLVIIGVVLSTLHQSSLGALFLIMPYRLHPLWYSPFLPLFFFISAVAVGLAMVIVESILSSKFLNHGLEIDLLSGLAKAASCVLGIYFVLKIIELAVSGELGLMLEGSLQSNLFLVELFLTVLLPAAMFALPRIRKSENALLWTALLVVSGLILNRLDVTILSQMVSGSYFPSWMEFAVTIGLIATGIVAYMAIVRFFPVFIEEKEKVQYVE